jgi:hypothetical protein
MVPGDLCLLWIAGHWLQVDHTESGSGGVELAWRCDDRGRSQGAFEEIDAIENWSNGFTVDVDVEILDKEIGDLLFDVLLNFNWDRL